jgi:hypothetical protein
MSCIDIKLEFNATLVFTIFCLIYHVTFWPPMNFLPASATAAKATLISDPDDLKRKRVCPGRTVT